jgi:predicted ester cyclase
MDTKENKTTTRRFFEAHNRHDLSAFDGLLAEDYVFYTGPRMAAAGRSLADYKERCRARFAAMPDFRATVEDMVAEGDKVAVRFTQLGTQEGKRITVSGICIIRFAKDKMVECWIVNESADE